MPYPISALRAVALHTHALTQPIGNEPVPGPEAIYRLIEQIGCLQIDTLQMVSRSHNMIIWSHLGPYDPADLDSLLYVPGQRRCFEYWFHAACIIPLTEYRYRTPTMTYYENHNGWQRWLSEAGNQAVVAMVRERIRQDGALRGGDFEYDGPQRGAWWDWKPAKNALEYLFAKGELMVADRVKFQRVYDLRERVLPAWVETTPVTREEMSRRLLIQAARVFGVCRAGDLSFLTHGLGRNESAPLIAELLAAGELREIQGELADGTVARLMIHRDNVALLERAAANDLPTPRTTFLNPFDSFWYPRGRAQEFWQLYQTLEAYVPAPKRRWGYFCLPILHRDRLVGRFDPKLERKNGLLRIKVLHLEPGVAPDEALAADMARAMRSFMQFHGATNLTIEQGGNAAATDLSQKLLSAL